MNVRDKILARVEVTGDCWRWTGYLDPDGYGRVRVGRTSRRPHRVMWEMENGPVPEGLELDHGCHHPWCVNPDHLEAVTHAENVRRGNSPTALNARKTRCKHGHEFTAENTYSPGGRRSCRACNRAAVARYKARRSVAA